MTEATKWGGREQYEVDQGIHFGHSPSVCWMPETAMLERDPSDRLLSTGIGRKPQGSWCCPEWVRTTGLGSIMATGVRVGVTSPGVRSAPGASQTHRR
jgi:hypothetical protein